MTHRHDFRISSLPKPEIGRERVRQACHRCRLKKLKARQPTFEQCDGIVPCGRCIKDDMICQHRERKGTGIEQTHSEYVSRLEEQQRILATALKLTWTRLYPDEGGQMPSAHDIIMRLRLMPADCPGGAGRRESSDDTDKQSPEVGPDVPSPPDLSQGQLESAQSSVASTPAISQQQPDLLSFDFSSGGQRADMQNILHALPDYFAKAPLDWTMAGDLLDAAHDSLADDSAERHGGPMRHLSVASSSGNGSGAAAAAAAQSGGFGTVEPWQLMLDER